MLARLGDGGAGEQGREGGGASRLGEDANLVPELARSTYGETTANAISPARLVPSESAAYPL